MHLRMIVQRWWATAMMNPSDVFPRFERTKKEHLSEGAQLQLPWLEPFVVNAPSLVGDALDSMLATLADGSPAEAPGENESRQAAVKPPRKGRKGFNHGGRRAGAGRKPAPRAKTLHRARVVHDPDCPVHVVLRLRPEIIPTLRLVQIRKLVKNIVWDQTHPSRIYAEAFRTVEFSIQRHELHLIVEAKALPGVTTKAGKPYTATQALRGGVSGFMISFAHRLNKLAGRGQKGKVWASRYERRDLRTPEAARDALETIFRMGGARGQHVVEEVSGIDEFSSASSFAWFENRPALPEIDEVEEGWPVLGAETALARLAWRAAGPIYSTPLAELRGGESALVIDAFATMHERSPLVDLDDTHREHIRRYGRPTSDIRGAYHPYLDER